MQAPMRSAGGSRSLEAKVQRRQGTSALHRPRLLLGVRTHASAAGRESQPGGSHLQEENVHQDGTLSRREGVLRGLGAGLAAWSWTLHQALSPPAAHAYAGLDYKQEIARRRKKIPIEQFSNSPLHDGLKYYDIIVGDGAEVKEGARVAVHYDVKFRNITFITSRMGLGVTGGSPVGFNVGAEGAGGTLPGIDLGVRGMRVGGLRRLSVPPELAYGSRGVGEIPPNATLMVDVELLSIKTSPLGYRTKLVEG